MRGDWRDRCDGARAPPARGSGGCGRPSARPGRRAVQGETGAPGATGAQGVWRARLARPVRPARRVRPARPARLVRRARRARRPCRVPPAPRPVAPPSLGPTGAAGATGPTGSYGPVDRPVPRAPPVHRLRWTRRTHRRRGTLGPAGPTGPAGITSTHLESRSLIDTSTREPRARANWHSPQLGQRLPVRSPLLIRHLGGGARISIDPPFLTFEESRTTLLESRPRPASPLPIFTPTGWYAEVRVNSTFTNPEALGGRPAPRDLRDLLGPGLAGPRSVV